MEHGQVLGLEKANSAEFDPDTPDPVVIFMPEVCIHSKLVLKKPTNHILDFAFSRFQIYMQGSKTHMGSTMRLGSRRTLFQNPRCIASKLYVIDARSLLSPCSLLTSTII